uniref:Uncharacterized protein n=1 Tax=Zea mays TaxID=4577 RepID=A0A804LTT2_MAIZE
PHTLIAQLQEQSEQSKQSERAVRPNPHGRLHNAAPSRAAPAPAPAGLAGGHAPGVRRLRGREVPGGACVRVVRGPAEAGRVAALDVRRVQELPVGGVRGGARGGGRVGGVGPEPYGRGHGRRAGAGGAGGGRGRGARRADVQHHGVRPAGQGLHAAGLPGDRPRRGRRGRQDPGVRQAAAAQGDEGREPGVAGRRVLHGRRPRQARVPGGQPRRQEQARPRRQGPRGGRGPLARPRARGRRPVRGRRQRRGRVLVHGAVQVPQRRRARGRRVRARATCARAGGVFGGGMVTREWWSHHPGEGGGGGLGTKYRAVFFLLGFVFKLCFWP